MLRTACLNTDVPGRTLDTSYINHYDLKDIKEPVSYFSRFHGVIISGSENGVQEIHKLEWISHLSNIIKEIHAADCTQLVGLCFGHQIICYTLGTSVVKNDKGLEMGNFPITLYDDAVSYLSTLAGKYKTVPNPLRLQFVHSDVVISTPKSCFDIGYTDVCEDQGVYNKKNVLTFQGHPEFSVQVLRDLISDKHKAGGFGNLPPGHTVETVRGSLDNRIDDDVIGVIILNFIAQRQVANEVVQQ